ncbi:MAG: hypothetical protein JXA94_05670 [Parachlamydiales bacterium]|nr:hypothetical protein [Parachlamydiales bacterium]
MRAINILISAVHLVILLFVVFVGVFFVSLFYASNYLNYFIDILSNKPQVLLTLGIIILSFSLLLFLLFYVMHKNQYLKIKMKPFQKVSIDTNVIRSYIEDFLKNSYPKNNVNCLVSMIPDNKLEIIANFDKGASLIKKDFLLHLELQIGKLLSDQLNYHSEFIFTLNMK